jgi:hypothetical protein
MLSVETPLGSLERNVLSCRLSQKIQRWTPIVNKTKTIAQANDKLDSFPRQLAFKAYGDTRP